MKHVVACGMGLALLFSSCSTVAVRPVAPITPTPAFVAWSQRGIPEKRVCVLPFSDQTGTEGLATQVRQSFAGHLSVKRFADAELHEIDARLATLAEGWKDHPIHHLGKTLACDALIYGEVTQAKRLYLGIYSQLALKGAIRVVDTTTGQILTQHSHTTRLHAGGVPLSPYGIMTNAILNLRNMTDGQMVRAIDDLSRHLAATVPDLPPVRSGQNISPSASPAETVASQLGNTLPTPEVTGQGSYRLQVAAFRSPHEAQQAAQLLRDKGYRPAIAEFTDTNRPWHRVVLGPFPSSWAAHQVGDAIQQSLPFSPIVTRTPAH